MEDGQKTLFAFYQRVRGYEGGITEEQIALAKKEGYLFDYPAYKTHEETLAGVSSLLARIDPKDVANAFLFSLSTRRLEYRSALGSYFYAKAIPEHEIMRGFNDTPADPLYHCYLCGWYAWKKDPGLFDISYGVNYYHYCRYKYGGQFLSPNLNYVIFDLEQFLELPKVIPTEEDKRILKEILACAGWLNRSDKAGKLRDTILKAGIFSTNKDEVSILLGILGICGILAGKDYPSYDICFANEYERSPAEHKNDFAYPVNRWHAADGINAAKLKEVFGNI